jgi:hypothetical protein
MRSMNRNMMLGAALAGMLMGCGGGGGDKNHTPPVVVTPPVTVPPVVIAPTPESRFSKVVISQATDVAAPIPNALHPSGTSNAYTGPRTYGYGDFNGDRCTDMVSAPTHFNRQPKLPIEIYQGDCQGNFTKASDVLIAGTIPTTGSVNHVFVRDFNGDGRDDIMLIDQGLEDLDSMTPGFDGAQNQLLLSDATGKLKLQPSTWLSDNEADFNHISTVADIDGNGTMDLVLVRLGGPKFGNGGLQVFLNDGTGSFDDKTAALLPWEVTAAGGDQFAAGGVEAADLDGDGKMELVLTSYSIGKTAILKKDSIGRYTIAGKYDMPAQYADIGYAADTRAANNGRGLGGSSVVVGDFNGDGSKDIAILWEGSNKGFVQILNGSGNLAFTDATSMVDGVLMSTKSSGPISRLQAIDANQDGVTDLAVEYFSQSINELATRSPYLVFNKDTNKMSFLNILGSMTAPQFATEAQTFGDDQLGFRVVDLNRDGKLDFLAVKAVGIRQVNATLNYYSGAAFYGAVAK